MSPAMSMCAACGHARMAHRQGRCSICDATCMAGYETVINAMHPVTPKAVRSHKRKPRAARDEVSPPAGAQPNSSYRSNLAGGARNEGRRRRPRRAPVEPVAPPPRTRKRRKTVHEQLTEFVRGEMSEIQIEAFTRLLESRHGSGTHTQSISDRLDAVVYRCVPPEVAAEYLEELHRRKASGAPLIKSMHIDQTSTD